MDRFFLFLVVRDDDPATQEGKMHMNSTNLLVNLIAFQFVWKNTDTEDVCSDSKNL